MIESSGALTVKDVRPGDEGVYSCRAENFLGQLNASAKLTVQCKWLNLYMIGMELKAVKVKFYWKLYGIRISSKLKEINSQTYAKSSVLRVRFKARLHRRFLSRNSMQFLFRRMAIYFFAATS